MANAPSDILNKLKNSDNPVLQAYSKDLQNWSGLKHNKSDLEYFLNFNIVELKFKTLKGEDRDCLYTSNTPFIKLFSAAAGERDKIIRESSKGIRTKDTLSVMSWNLIDRKLNTIPLREWQIVNWIGINKDNILALQTLSEYLIFGRNTARAQLEKKTGGKKQNRRS